MPGEVVRVQKVGERTPVIRPAEPAVEADDMMRAGAADDGGGGGGHEELLRKGNELYLTYGTY